MKLWIVGKWTDKRHIAWEFAGVFESEELAVAACETTEMFVGPAILN